MSIIVQIGGYGTVPMEFQENETVDQLLLRLKNQEHVSFRTVWLFQETQTGRTMPADEILVDDRMYFLTVTIEKAPRE